MIIRPICLAVAFILLSVVWIVGVGQEQLATADQQLTFLKHPSNLKLELARRMLERNESPEVLDKPFETEQRIYFRVLLTNTSLNPVSVLISNRYFQNRPKLVKDGQEVTYRENVLKLVSSAEKERVFDRNLIIRLEPSVPAVISYLDLADWYAPLESGRYELTNTYRFVPDGDWLESEVVTFEVRIAERKVHRSQ